MIPPPPPSFIGIPPGNPPPRPRWSSTCEESSLASLRKRIAGERTPDGDRLEPACAGSSRSGESGASARAAGSSAGASWCARSRPRTRKSETRTPTNEIAAPAQNAAWNPFVSASGCATPAATSSVVVETAIVERIAMPTAPPICCDVLMSPDARPASSGFVPATAAIVIGTNANGMPSPMMRKPGNRSVQYEPSTETCVK